MGTVELIVLFLVVIWFGGFFLKIGGKLIHILLILAIIVFLLKFLGILA